MQTGNAKSVSSKKSTQM